MRGSFQDVLIQNGRERRNAWSLLSIFNGTFVDHGGPKTA